MSIIDRISYYNAWSKKSPRAKVILGLGALFIPMILDLAWLQFLVLLFLLGAMVFGAKISPRVLSKLMVLPLGFLLLSMLTIVLSIGPQDPLLALGPVGITAQGMHMAARLFLRSLTGISALYFITLTTPVPQWLGVLKSWHLPVFLLELMLLMYRFIALFLKELEELMVALKLRGGENTVGIQLRAMASAMGSLTQRVFQEYESMERQLELKNFDGNFYF
ncbi:MAG: cobalt ECF transporter T component CbiQ [Tissierellia bacterium]|nr:cobalt ECF transporter T component CbiQ [Tissierellia bacterium]